MNIYSKRISKLAERMKRQGIDACLIPMCDDHNSEYVGDYYKNIRYFTGFTGSAGTLVVSAARRQIKGQPAYAAFLWTDGRYFIQAAEELKGSGIKLMKAGEEGVPAIPEFLSALKKSVLEAEEDRQAEGGSPENQAPAKYTVALDGRLFTTPMVENLARAIGAVKGGNAALVTEEQTADEVIEDDDGFERPEMPHSAIWELAPSFAGITREEKLGTLRDELENFTNADGERPTVFVLTALDEIAWLFNLRGGDVDFNPVFMAYALVTEDHASLFLNTGDYPRRILTPAVYSGKPPSGSGHEMYAFPYQEFFKALKKLAEAGAVIAYDRSSASYAVTSVIERNAAKKPVALTSPVRMMKAVKNHVEIENEKKAHLYDGVAITKLLYWLKTSVRTGEASATELSVAYKLAGLRAEQPHYLGESFAPISAYAEHAAIVHYEADEKSDAEIKNEGMLLLDTGGHYLEGTTDVTRTVVMNDSEHPLSKEEKQAYTAVLMGNLRLADAVFKAGTTGSSLDILAREPLFKIGRDFNHGTGHGVGYLLNVHEGPNNISMRRRGDAGFAPGMITSDEPGVYIEGKFGVRLENLLLCVEKDIEGADGTYLGFEPLTLVPFDHEAIDFSMMTEEDKRLLREYEEKVWVSISPRLSRKEREWLAAELKLGFDDPAGVP